MNGSNGTPLKHLDDLVKRIEAKKQVADDVRGELGNLYQEAEDVGFNRTALKLALKLKNMEDGKRNDFLSSLQAYCDHLGVWRQGDLLGDAPGVPHPPETPLGEMTPYLAGQLAAQEGHETSRNPYPQGGAENEAWRDGWLKACMGPGEQTASAGEGKAPAEEGSEEDRTGPPRRRGRPRRDANGSDLRQ